MNQTLWLTIAVCLPLIGALVVVCLPRPADTAARWTATGFAFAELLLAVPMLAFYKMGSSAVQFEYQHAWIRFPPATYHVGVDGISFPMVLLTVFMSFVAILASWPIKERVKEYFALMLLLETAMVGVFVSLDLVLFYVFWELVLIPMYLLIGMWGGPRREYAAIKFFLYTLAGSVLMLVGIFTVALNAVPVLRTLTFDIGLLAQGASKLPAGLQAALFLYFFAGFALKVPMFPFHTWLPDAHVEAPTAASVLLAGILLKMGSYGFIRIAIPLFPKGFERWSGMILVLALISIVYGAFLALAQSDLKRLVAYSSISHMGYVMLGIALGTTVSMDGAVLQMVSHGLITGMLFLLVGTIYERTHTREIGDLGGLSGKIPLLAGLLVFASLAALGLPALSGFVAEFMILSAFYFKYGLWTLVPMVGVVVTVGYLLWMVQRVCYGELPETHAELPEATGRELVTLLAPAVMVVAIGVWPALVIKMVDPAVAGVLGMIGGGR